MRLNNVKKQKARLGRESGLAVEIRLLSAVARNFSAGPSSPSRPVPACTFDHRHSDEGGGANWTRTHHGKRDEVFGGRRQVHFFGPAYPAYPYKAKAAVLRPPLSLPKC